VFVANLFELN